MTIAIPSIRSGKGDSIGFMPILSPFFNVNYSPNAINYNKRKDFIYEKRNIIYHYSCL